MDNCIYCGKKLIGRKIKYCNELCSYRYNSIQNEKPGKFSHAQHKRIRKAESNQRKGKVGCRYN